MTEKRFQKRYIEKNNKVYDTWKKMPITDELNSDSLFNVLSHLNGLGEIIDIKIKQGRYCVKKYNELEEENEQLKQFKEKVFNIINKKLQDNEKLDGVDTAMYYANRQTLNELKKELEE